MGRARYLYGLFVAAGILLISPALSGQTGAASSSETASPGATPAVRAVIDPVTGELTVPPAAGEIPAQVPGGLPELSPGEQSALDRSDAGLQERDLPGGAVAVDLQGGFRTMAVGTVDGWRQAGHRVRRFGRSSM